MNSGLPLSVRSFNEFGTHGPAQATLVGLTVRWGGRGVRVSARLGATTPGREQGLLWPDMSASMRTPIPRFGFFDLGSEFYCASQKVLNSTDCYR